MLFPLSPRDNTTFPGIVCPCAFHIVHALHSRMGNIVLVFCTKSPLCGVAQFVVSGKHGTHFDLSSSSGKKDGPWYESP